MRATFLWRPQARALWPRQTRRRGLTRTAELFASVAVVAVLAASWTMHSAELPVYAALALAVGALLVLLRYVVGWWLVTAGLAVAVAIRPEPTAAAPVPALGWWLPVGVAVAYLFWQANRPFFRAPQRRVPAVSGFILAAAIAVSILGATTNLPRSLLDILGLALIALPLALGLALWAARQFGAWALPEVPHSAPGRLMALIYRGVPSSRWRLVHELDRRRTYVARSLHGEAQPWIVAALHALELNNVQRAKRNIEDARGALIEAADDTNPPNLPRPGLLPALEAMAMRAAGRWGGTAKVVVVNGVRGEPPPAVELAAYQVARRAVTNALRHTQTRDVEIRISALSAGRVELSILDLGDGFALEDVRAAAARGARGLAEMHSASADVGARLAFRKRQPKGMQIDFTWHRRGGG